MSPVSRHRLCVIGAMAIALCAPGLARAAIMVDTTTAKDWKISNGAIALDWNSTNGHIYSIHLVGYPDEFIDVTNASGGQPKGLYMDNTGLGSGATTEIGRAARREKAY